jgi:hypothetical protein
MISQTEAIVTTSWMTNLSNSHAHDMSPMFGMTGVWQVE